MIEQLTRRFLHHRRPRSRTQRQMFAACCLLERRELLSGANLSLVSENLQNNGADIGALFPSVSANGQYVAFESGSFSGGPHARPIRPGPRPHSRERRAERLPSQPRDQHDDLLERQLPGGEHHRQ